MIIDVIIWQFQLYNFGNCNCDGEYDNNIFTNSFDYWIINDYKYTVNKLKKYFIHIAN